MDTCNALLLLIAYPQLPYSMHFNGRQLKLLAALTWTSHKVGAQVTGDRLPAAPADAIDVPSALGIDTSTLPTFLVVASSSVPEFTGAIPSLFQPKITEAMGSNDDDTEALQATKEAPSTKRTKEEPVTEITTTMLTVANGSTTSAALTTTIPVSILDATEEEGSGPPKSAISKSRSFLAIMLAVISFNHSISC